MAITVNGKKVAGVGPAGLSPYQVAKAGGYTGSEQEFNEALAKLNELFTSVSEGKSLIAAAVTDKGVETAADATFQQMADNVKKIDTGVSIKTGSANGTPYQSGKFLVIDFEVEIPENKVTIFTTSVNPYISFTFINQNNYSSNVYGSVAIEYVSYSGGILSLKVYCQDEYPRGLYWTIFDYSL